MTLAATNLGIINGIGPLGESNRFIVGYGPAAQALAQVISVTLGILTICAGLYFIFQVFSGAIQWLGSGGEKQALENAKKRITNAIVGLLLVILSFAIISIIGLVFGLPDILNPLGFFSKI